MAYQALYRTYRSQTFHDVVGQEAITRTLRHAIVQDKLSHAYLFTGPRGTGKTSCAKILAKAINCPHQHDGEPCNECDICHSITEGRLNDVIEIDAASNNGVEEIRDIRDKVKYAPTEAKYKVYIIDEVHMLSKGAFNALLKTLEEPPHHVIFILATTEPHKIPATIISRTQRFDFKRIADEAIVQHLSFILNKQGVVFEEAALRLIARVAEGGMRDALSILDQVLAFCEGDAVTLQDAVDITGSLTTDMMDRYLMHCAKQETEQALQKLADILANGKESTRFIEDLLYYCRDLLMYQQKALKTTPTEDFKQLAQLLSTEHLYAIIQRLTETQKEMRLSTYHTVYLEMMTIQLAQPFVQKMLTQEVAEDNQIIQELSQKIEMLQREVLDLKADAEHVKVNGPIRQVVQQKERPTTFREDLEALENILMEANRQYLTELQEAWSDIMNILTSYQRGMLNAEYTVPVAASETGVVLSSKEPVFIESILKDEQFIQQLKQAIQQIVQRSVHIEFVRDSEWGQIRQNFLEKRKAQKQPEDFKEAETTPKVNKENQVVEEAKRLFDADLIQIIDD